MRTDFNKLKYGLELGGSLSRKSGAVKSSVIQKKMSQRTVRHFSCSNAKSKHQKREPILTIWRADFVQIVS